MKGKCGMRCEEFEAVGLGLDREGAGDLDGDRRGVDPIEFAAALEHVNTCVRCAALQESWQEAQLELRALREATQNVGAPLGGEISRMEAIWRAAPDSRRGFVWVNVRAAEFLSKRSSEANSSAD